MGKAARKRGQECLGKSIESRFNLLFEREDEFPVSELVVWGKNPRNRISPEALDALAATIKELGIQSPLKAFWENDQLVVFDGGRRLRACQKIGKKTVPVDIYEELDPKIALLLGTAQNVSHENMTPFEEGQAFADLLESNDLSLEEVAKACGKTEKFVLGRIALLSLPKNKEIDAALTAKKITLGDVECILCSPPGVQDKIFESIIEFRRKILEDMGRVPRSIEVRAHVMDELEDMGEGVIEGKGISVARALPRNLQKQVFPRGIPSSAKGRKAINTKPELLFRAFATALNNARTCLEAFEKMSDEELGRQNIENLIQRGVFNVSVLTCAENLIFTIGEGDLWLERMRKIGHDVPR